MPDNFFITQSNIIALWRLIMIVKRNSLISVETAIYTLRDSGAIGGGLPADQGLKLGLYCKLLAIDDPHQLVHTDSCKDNLLPLCNTDEPNILITRAILLKYMSFENWDWLLFFDEDPVLFKASIPTEWSDLLEQSNLFDLDDPEVRSWWAEVFKRFETYKEGKKADQGKLAEKLTFDSEKVRLMDDGFDHGHKFVKWASLWNDKYGYDILSIRGVLLKSLFVEKDKIQIEVKSAASDSMEQFRFFVSKPEWKTALNNLDSYYFYCWVDTNIHSQTANGPYIIPAKDLSSHVPTDHSPMCDWSECRFIVDLNSMKIN